MEQRTFNLPDIVCREDPGNDVWGIVSDTIYHIIGCCPRNMISEDDEAKKQRIAAHIPKVLRTGRI